MRKLWYVGLEPYQARYTLQLTTWNETRFKERGIDYELVKGQTLGSSNAIHSGQVLDAHGRSYFALSQMMEITKLLQTGKIQTGDVLYFDDMFHPGLEALPYILDQTPYGPQPKVFVRCHAQSVDPDDFIHVWNMARWMRHYESMVNEFASVLATSEEMVANMKIAGWKGPLYNISGLSYDKREVLSRCSNRPAFDDRPLRIAFAARFDREKQPGFFLDLVEELSTWSKSIEFVILSGGTLRSNAPEFIHRARKLGSTYNLTIKDNLSKEQYYEELSNCRVLFNCALQDWFSYTLPEADTLGTNVVYPAYRSSHESFANDASRLYIPWSLKDATDKVLRALTDPSPAQGKISDWVHGTIDRVLDIFEGKGEQWNRTDSDYRKHLVAPKY